MKAISIRAIAEIGILTAMMTILGGMKIPNIIPGVEFQLSALSLSLFVQPLVSANTSSAVVCLALSALYWVHKICST